MALISPNTIRSALHKQERSEKKVERPKKKMAILQMSQTVGVVQACQPHFTQQKGFKKQRTYFRLLFIPVLFVKPEEFLLVATGSEDWALLR